MTNPRVRKIADRIQVIVAEMLERRIKDPRLGFVTITDVRVTGDSQQATIFYTVLGAEDASCAEHRRGAGVGQGRDPLRGRQAARHAHRADADLHPRRAARDRPRTSTRCSRGPRRSTTRSPPARARRTPARPTRTRSRARSDERRRSTRTVDDDSTRTTAPDGRPRSGRRRQARRA